MKATENNFGFMEQESLIEIPFFKERMYGKKTSGNNFLKTYKIVIQITENIF